ncbi:hypothetical protein BDR06DRAFT_1007055 [Suillus hirtellus]|nr:hypothetical protein BDR06DRAFT_1007055 [Suillus hirtellus]
MAISGKPFSIDKLSDILFHITQMPRVTLPVQSAIRAVAFLLEDTAEMESVDKISKLVIAAISPHIAKFQETSEKTLNTTMQLTETHTKIIHTASQLDKTQEKISELTTNINTGTASEMTNIDSRLEKVQEAMSTLTTQVKEANQGRYKAALMKGINNINLDPQAAKCASRSAIRVRQVLIDIPKDSNLAPGKILHDQLVEKVKEALKAITKENSPDLDFCAITQFQNGGTMIKFQSIQVAEYLKNKNYKETFIQALDPNASIKEQSYPVVVQFIPITFNPSSAEQL